MDAFEEILGLYLQEKNYWIRHSVKVEITKEEKNELQNPSMPRPEIDIVAYDAASNELILIEAKSFLNSDGVKIGDLNGNNTGNSSRYKLLNNENFQKIVTKNLRSSFEERGIINNTTEIKYGLAAGKVQNKSKKQVKKFLEDRGYYYFSPEDIKNTIKNLANTGWDDNIITVTAKLTC